MYIRAMGGYPIFLLLALWFIMCEAARVGATVWLSHWTGVADQPGTLFSGNVSVVLCLGEPVDRFCAANSSLRSQVAGCLLC